MGWGVSELLIPPGGRAETNEGGSPCVRVMGIGRAATHIGGPRRDGRSAHHRNQRGR